MKTSNKLVLAALTVLLVGLAFFNNALQAEYRTGSFRDPLHNFVTLPVRDFSSLHLQAANLASIQIQRGPYSVRVFKPLADVLQVQQHGRELTLGVSFPGESQSYSLSRERFAIVISCPDLTALRTDASYTVKGKAQTDKKQPWDRFRVLVKGFQQDSLSIQADNGSMVELRDNTLQRLRVVAGPTDGGPVVRLYPGNHVQQASFVMGGKSKLIFDELAIPQLAYQFADSATTTLPGRSLSSFANR